MNTKIATDTNTKLIRESINSSRNYRKLGSEKANADAVLVLSDAVRDAGNDELADLLGSVGRFLKVWAQHRCRVWGYTDCITYASDRSKFIALDYGTSDSMAASGCFLVEKATGYVWTIKGYGKKNRVCATSLDELAATYQANIDEPRCNVRGRTGEMLAE